MKLSDREKIEIVNSYVKGISGTKLAKKYNVYPTTIYSILRRRDIKIRNVSHCHRKYNINEQYFDKINTEGKAYFLGLLFADGYNVPERGMIRIFLQEEDKEILCEFRKRINYEKPLYFRDYTKKGWCNQYGLCITNKHMSNQLNKIGCKRNKSKDCKFPNISKKFVRHFIRGYYDGDGSLRWAKNGKFNVPKGVLDIVGSKSFCLSLRNIIIKKLKMNIGMYEHSCSKKHEEQNKKMYIIALGGNNKIKKFLRWIYKDSNVYFQRKFDKYQELLRLTTPKIKYNNLRFSHMKENKQ